MDASKVNGRGMYRFAELTDVDTIVMDRDPDHAVATSIAEDRRQTPAQPSSSPALKQKPPQRCLSPLWWL